MKRNTSGKPALFWRIVITFIGLFLILSTISNAALFMFGETTHASVTSRRFGGSNNGYPADKRYEWSVEYSFFDKDGSEYTGYSKRRGSDMSVEVSREARYFDFAPFINSLSDEAVISPIQLISISIGLFLIYVINWDVNKKES